MRRDALLSLFRVRKEIENTSVLFLHGAVIDPQYHSQGLYWKLLNSALGREKTEWLATRTQNPRICESLLKIADINYFYPYPNREIPLSIQEFGRSIVDNDSRLNSKNFVITNVYKEDRTGAAYHRCREEWITDFFQSNLGLYDAFLILARRKV